MLRASNINSVAKTASFYMDGYDAYVLDYDLTLLSYRTDDQSNDYLDIDPSILDSGTDLTTVQAIDVITTYPRVNGNKLAKELIAAKDAV